MIPFPEQRIAPETPTSKLWRWWTAKGWSWNTNDTYQSLTVTNDQDLRIPIFFDRTQIKIIDVFQIWMFNIKSVNGIPFRGYFDVSIDQSWIRRQFIATGSPPDYGTAVILNFDESEIKGKQHVTFDLHYYGQPLFLKSLELYAVLTRSHTKK